MTTAQEMLYVLTSIRNWYYEGGHTGASRLSGSAHIWADDSTVIQMLDRVIARARSEERETVDNSGEWMFRVISDRYGTDPCTGTLAELQAMSNDVFSDDPPTLAIRGEKVVDETGDVVAVRVTGVEH